MRKKEQFSVGDVVVFPRYDYRDDTNNLIIQGVVIATPLFLSDFYSVLIKDEFGEKIVPVCSKNLYLKDLKDKLVNTL